MEEYDLRDVSYEKLNRGYENQWELMDDLFAWLDLRIYFFYEHHQWLGPKNDMRNMMGLVVSREEFEHNLVKAAQLGLAAQLDGGEAAQLESSQVTIRARLERTRAEFPLLRMFRELGLEEFEEGCLVLAYAAALDQKYEKLLAYLQDDITQKVPTTRPGGPAVPPPGADHGGVPVPLCPPGQVYQPSLTGSAWRPGSWCCAPRCWSFSAPGRWPPCPDCGSLTGRGRSPPAPW